MANKSITDLLADFEQRAARQQFRASLMQEEAQNALNALLAQQLEHILQGSADAVLHERIAALEAQLCAVQEVCPLCGGKGVVNGVLCTCFLKEAYVQVYGARRIEALQADDSLFDEAVFDDAHPLQGIGKTQREYMRMYRQVCRKYVDAFPDTPKANMLLKGKAGTGKTFLLECIAKRAQARGIDVCLIGAGALFSAFHRHRLGEGETLSLLHDARLLLIDDLGSEPVTQNVSVEYFFDLINSRQEKKLHTVVSTNVEDLQRRYDERVWSRLRNRLNTSELRFDGADVRLRSGKE